MTGGVKKPINVFKLSTTGEPKEIFNRRLWFSVISFALLGAARGVDEGLIAGAFNSADFKKTIHYDSYSESEQASIKGNVSAMVQIGSMGGALFAFIVCDRIGRLWATRLLCLIWIVGISIFLGNNGSLGAIYIGRLIAGIGIGQTPVVGPIYIAEIAPASIRGLCTCFFTGFVYLGIVLAYFANYGCKLHLDPNHHAIWQVPTSLHIMFAGLILALSFLQHESPRYLVRSGKTNQALKIMSHLRHLPPDHDYVAHEIEAIKLAHHLEMKMESTSRGAGWLGILREAFTVPANLYRICLALGAQIMSQWSGAGSITIYAVDFFSLVGISGSNESLLVTAIFGIVKFCAAVICALFLVDVVGRKRALLTGITLQAIAMIYVASFLTSIPELGVVHDFELPASRRGLSRGAIFMIFLSGFGWALGWNSMQYLLTAELFPLRIRAFATSLAMCFHFANQYGNTRAVPNMLLPAAEGGISPKGTFWCFAAVTLLGGAWVWFFVPETSGRSLETMDRLFALPWWRIGRHGSWNAELQDAAVDEKPVKLKEVVMHVEGDKRDVETAGRRSDKGHDGSRHTR